MSSSNTKDREIILTRVFDAPRELVFSAYTDPTHVVRWFGPRGFGNTTFEMSVKPGGRWRFIMHGPDGTDYTNRIVYTEVVPNELLAFDHGSDVDDDPRVFKVRITFERLGERQTRVTQHTVFSTPEQLAIVKGYGAVEKGKETLERLAEYLATSAEHAFVVTRTFDAPREMVFMAHAEKERLARWWGPKGWALEVKALDFRAGGVFHYAMRMADHEMWGKFVYRDIVMGHRIVYVSSFSDPHGNVTRAPFFDGKWPLETLNTVTFTEQDGKTTLTLRAVPIDATAEELAAFASNFKSMQGGFGGTYQQLEDALRADTLSLSRVFDAPRDRVFKAWTDARAVQQWWGPHHFTAPRCELDVRPGGAIRIDMRAPDGNVYPMSGTYKDVVALERLVFVSAALDAKGNPLFEVLNVVTFADQGGKTALTVHASLMNATAEAKPYLSGMEEGWKQQLERFGAHLAK